MNPPESNQEYFAFAKIKNGRITVATELFPPRDLAKDEIFLTKEEYNLLRRLLPHYTEMGNVKRLAKSLEAKIRKLE